MSSLTISVADECEHRDCHDDPVLAYVVTGESGRDGIAVYCDLHSQAFADESPNHTALNTIEGYYE